MAERRPSLMEPRIEQLMSRSTRSSRWSRSPRCGPARSTTTTTSSARASGRIVPPQVTSVSRKPLSIALEEIAVGKIVYERIDLEAEAEAGAAVAAARSRARPTPRADLAPDEPA